MKRGNANQWFFAVVEIVVAALMIVALFFIGSKFFTACTEQEKPVVFEDQDRFASAIETLAENKQDDAMYVPFISNWEEGGDIAEYYDFLVYGRQVSPKPASCHGEACLCVVRFGQSIPSGCVALNKIDSCTGASSSDTPCIYFEDSSTPFLIQPMFSDGVKVNMRDNLIWFET
ncbi:hypothetical protein KY329_05155 [Candidatus Woesearchaeota archaeon]|nr:hypothetical protein [Candidatus Woesearchaeota archaeon]